MAARPLTVVVGAGISGLACAYSLKLAGENVLLTEASSRSGGVIQTVAENGYLFELGPQSFTSNPSLDELCFRLGLAGEILEAPHGAPRYVLIDGRLQNVPLSPPSFFTSGILRWKTKVSILKDLFGKTAPPAGDESISEFVRRKFTPELLEKLVGPFVSGIYAGDPERLSLRAAFPKIYQAELRKGGVLRGAFRSTPGTSRDSEKQSMRRPGLLSFQGGNLALATALGKALGDALRLHTTVSGIGRTAEGFLVTTAGPSGNSEILCKKLVLATPADATAGILHSVAPLAAEALRKISYAPVAVVSLGYRSEQVGRSLEGFGFLVPRSARVRTLGTVWNSSLFPGRAPHGRVQLTSFVGGETDREAASLSSDALAALVHREIAPLLQITGIPEASRITNYLRGIPQYNLGHLDLLGSAASALKAIPGLHAIGNYWNGPAVGACVERAQAVADEIRIG